MRAARASVRNTPLALVERRMFAALRTESVEEVGVQLVTGGPEFVSVYFDEAVVDELADPQLGIA